MEAFGAVVHRPMAVISAGFTDSVCQRKSLRVEVSKKLVWSGCLSNSVFLDKGYLEYYSSDRIHKFGCRKVFSGAKTEKKMKKKDTEAKEKKKSKMLKGLSRDLLMFSKMGCGLESDREVQPEMISDAVMTLQAQLQQLVARENELMLKSEAEQNRNLDSEMLSSCSESSDSECDSEAINVVLDSAIDMQQDPVVLLQGQMKQLRIKGKEVKKERKQERKRRTKKLDCGMQSSSSSESSDSECEKLSNMNNLSCFLLPAEKQSAIELQEIVPQMSSISTTKVLEEDNWSSSRVKDFGQGCMTEIAEYTVKPKRVEESTTKRVEVCMGGKCKKSGALLLMEEFQRQIGIEGAVLGCKCMGKCKSGPNVRLFKNDNGLLANSLVPEPPRSVGLGDVGSIVENILGESGLRPGTVEI